MKKIFAIIVAAMMVMALSVSVFADDIDVSGMDLAFEWTEGKAVAHDNWWTAKSVFSDEDFAMFIACLNTPGAVVEIAGNNPGSGGTMTNFGTDFGKGYMYQLGNYPTGDYDLYASIDTMKAEGKAPETFEDAIFQFYIYEDTATEVSINKIAVYVPAGTAPTPAAPAADDTPADTPAADAPAADAPTDAPAADAPAKAPSTGIALAVVPAVVAMAAAYISKKH